MTPNDICKACGTYHEERCELFEEIRTLKAQLAWTATFLRREHDRLVDGMCFPDCSVCALLKAVAT